VNPFSRANQPEDGTPEFAEGDVISRQR